MLHTTISLITFLSCSADFHSSQLVSRLQINHRLSRYEYVERSADRLFRKPSSPSMPMRISSPAASIANFWSQLHLVVIARKYYFKSAHYANSPPLLPTTSPPWSVIVEFAALLGSNSDEDSSSSNSSLVPRLERDERKDRCGGGTRDRSYYLQWCSTSRRRADGAAMTRLIPRFNETAVAHTHTHTLTRDWRVTQQCSVKGLQNLRLGVVLRLSSTFVVWGLWAENRYHSVKTVNSTPDELMKLLSSNL